MGDVDQLTFQLLELSKQLANSSKSFKITLKTKDINFTFSSQGVHNPGQDDNNPGAKISATKKKKKSPSQKKRDTERRKFFLLKKLENTNKSTKPSEDIITSSEHGEPEESFLCEICEMKANCKVSLGKHKQKEHSTIPQLDGGGDLGDNDPSILPSAPDHIDHMDKPATGYMFKWNEEDIDGSIAEATVVHNEMGGTGRCHFCDFTCKPNQCKLQPWYNHAMNDHLEAVHPEAWEWFA